MLDRNTFQFLACIIICLNLASNFTLVTVSDRYASRYVHLIAEMSGRFLDRE